MVCSMPIFIVYTINEEINFHPSKYLSNLRSESILGGGMGNEREVNSTEWGPGGCEKMKTGEKGLNGRSVGLHMGKI